MASHTPKNQRNFSHFFALVSKMGQIKKIQALYHIECTLITNQLMIVYYIFFKFDPF